MFFFLFWKGHCFAIKHFLLHYFECLIVSKNWPMLEFEFNIAEAILTWESEVDSKLYHTLQFSMGRVQISAHTLDGGGVGCVRSPLNEVTTKV